MHDDCIETDHTNSHQIPKTPVNPPNSTPHHTPSPPATAFPTMPPMIAPTAKAIKTAAHPPFTWAFAS